MGSSATTVEKHSLWRLGPDAEQNRVIFAAVKNWFNPTAHTVNKQWIERKANGWTSVGRVQCEACGSGAGRRRRSPAGLQPSTARSTLGTAGTPHANRMRRLGIRTSP